MSVYEQLINNYSYLINRQNYTSFKQLKYELMANELVEDMTAEKIEIIIKQLKEIYKTTNKRMYTDEVFEYNYLTLDENDENYELSLTSTEKCILIKNLTDEEYNDRCKKFQILKDVKQPVQRSPEWFAMRSKCITASDCGVVLNENHWEPQYNFILKKIFGQTFKGDIKTTHGRRFEQSCILTYELLHNVKVYDFGLMAHHDKNITFLSASPDGICFTENSPLVGRMLEIKCPLSRKINTSGTIKDHVCPLYYWNQVQLQLECCNLEECDFVQCKIVEYKDRNEYINDTNPECHYRSKSYGKPRGAVIELLPTNLSADKYINGIPTDEAIYEDTTFIHPPYLNMSNDELNNWILFEIDNLTKRKDVKLNKVVYWKMTEHVFTLIKRDRVWFADKKEKMRFIWNYVLILRDNMDIAEEWKLYIENLKTKNNVKIFKKLDELINNKIKNKISPHNNVSEEEHHDNDKQKSKKFDNLLDF